MFYKGLILVARSVTTATIDTSTNYSGLFVLTHHPLVVSPLKISFQNSGFFLDEYIMNPGVSTTSKK